jgi:hypothetical protein
VFSRIQNELIQESYSSVRTDTTQTTSGSLSLALINNIPGLWGYRLMAFSKLPRAAFEGLAPRLTQWLRKAEPHSDGRLPLEPAACDPGTHFLQLLLRRFQQRGARGRANSPTADYDRQSVAHPGSRGDHLLEAQLLAQLHHPGHQRPGVPNGICRCGSSVRRIRHRCRSESIPGVARAPAAQSQQSGPGRRRIFTGIADILGMALMDSNTSSILINMLGLEPSVS